MALAAVVLVATVVLLTHHSTNASLATGATVTTSSGPSSTVGASPSTTAPATTLPATTVPVTVAVTAAPTTSLELGSADLPPSCAVASQMAPLGSRVAASQPVVDATSFQFPTGGLDIYGPLTPDNNEPMATADDGAVG